MLEIDQKQSVGEEVKESVEGVDIYLRLPNAKSCKIRVAIDCLLANLKATAEIKFGILQRHQTLFYKGEDCTHEHSILLTANAIVHVQEIVHQQNQICIHLIHQFNSSQSSISALSACVDSTILDLVKSQCNIDSQINNIRVISSGRLLNIDQTLHQQRIQNGAQLNLIYLNTPPFITTQYQAAFQVTQSQPNISAPIYKSIEKLKNLLSDEVNHKKEISVSHCQKSIHYPDQIKSSHKHNRKNSKKLTKTQIHRKRQCNCDDKMLKSDGKDEKW